MSDQRAAEEAMLRVRGIELVISGLLRTGVVVSILLVVAGSVVSFVHGGWVDGPAATTKAQPGASRVQTGLVTQSPALARLVTVRTPAPFPHTMGELAGSLGQGQGRGIIMLGLLVLIATPVMRVAVSIAAFAGEGDRRFAIITTIVLILLLVSFVLGKAKG